MFDGPGNKKLANVLSEAYAAGTQQHTMNIPIMLYAYQTSFGEATTCMSLATHHDVLSFDALLAVSC